VLLNARHHFYQRHRKPPPRVRLDPASSAAWFDGWKPPQPPPPSPASTPSGPPKEIANPGTWLLRKGWRRHHLLDPAEVPGAPGLR
jgi:putative transposase